MKRLILILSAICLGCQSASDYSQAGRNLEITFAEIEEISSKSGETTPEEKSQIAEELKISTVDLFIFNTAGKLENRTRFSSDIYQPKTVSVTTAGEKSIYAIANADGNINLENLPNNDAITTSDIESLEIFHKNIHTTLPYVSKSKQKLDLLTTPKIELKFQRVHAKIEIINQTPEQLTISSLEISGLPNKAYLFKPETPQSTEYNQKSTETTFYTFATQTPIKVELTSEVNGAAKKIIKEFPKVLSSETNIINITKVDNSEIKILSNDDWQGYQSSGVHQLGDISVVSEGASFNTDGTLLIYSNATDYTLNLSAPNYTISDLTLKSNQPWLTISKGTNPYKITIQKNDKEEERTAVLSINKANTAIKYIVVKQAKKPIIYYIQEPIKDNIKQKLAEKLEVAGGAKSGVLSVELSAYETLAPFAMDIVDGITKSNEELTAQTIKLNFAQIKAGAANKRTTNLKINRAGTTQGAASELTNITITQTPHTLSVPDYAPFISTNSPEQNQTVTATGADSKYDWSATTQDTWLTATKSTTTLKLKPTNNLGAERTTKVALTYDGTTLEKTVTQQNGYNFSLTTADATIESGNNLKTYSIAKTYTVTLTPLEAIDFTTIKATITGQPTWEITQPKGENATGTSTKGTFTIKLPAATLTTEPEATISLKIGSIEVKTLKVTQAKKVSFSPAACNTPYNIIGGESTKPVVTISASTWDISTQTPATGAEGTLSITTDQAANKFTINAAETLSYNTAQTKNTLTLKNNKGETISTYKVTQTPVTFTITTVSFPSVLAAGEERSTTVTTTDNLPWTVNAPTYTPTTSKDWLTAENKDNKNATLTLTSKASILSTTRTASLTLTSKGTRSQAIALTQQAYTAPSKEVTIGNQIWLNFNVGTTPGTLVNTVPSYDWESSKGGLYTWANAPTSCPAGYRLPNTHQFETLLANTSKNYVKNGEKLYLLLTDKMGTSTTTLELPASGYRNGGTLSNEGTRGYYWSSIEGGSSFAYMLHFYDGSASANSNYDKTYELNVRCIKPKPDPSNALIGNQVWLKYNVGPSKGTYSSVLPSSNWEASKGGYYNWEESKTACPIGYRLPSKAEYDTLLSNTDKTYPKNGTNLYLKLTDKTASANTLEFAAGGFRRSGTLTSNGTNGFYWSSTEHSNVASALFLSFKSNFFTTGNGNIKTDESSVRCIAE